MRACECLRASVASVRSCVCVYGCIPPVLAVAVYVRERLGVHANVRWEWITEVQPEGLFEERQGRRLLNRCY